MWELAGKYGYATLGIIATLSVTFAPSIPAGKMAVAVLGIIFLVALVCRENPRR